MHPHGRGRRVRRALRRKRGARDRGEVRRGADCMSLPDGQLEWLEHGPRGSFALGCVDRRLRRKYHALLTVREPGRGDAWNVLAEVHEHDAQGDAAPVLLCDTVSGSETDATLSGFTTTPCATHRYRIGTG